MNTRHNTDYYQELYHSVKATLPGNHLPWFTSLREEALAHLLEHGFPTRHDEDWKYSAPHAFDKHQFSYSPGNNATSIQIPDFTLIQTQGKVLGLEQIQQQLPPGVIITDIATAALQHPQLLKQYLAKSAAATEHGFIALNTALLQNGLFIYLAKHCELGQTLTIQYHNASHQAMQQVRNVIVVEEAAQLTVTETFQGEDNLIYFNNIISELYLARNAHVTHTKLQYEGDHSFHVGKLYATQHEASHFESHSFSFGGLWVRSDTEIKFDNVGASCLLNGLYIAASHQQVDHHTFIQHAKPENKSQQYYKGILKDDGRAVFNGKVLVAKDAQHTDSSQYNKNILLSPTAQVNTKPQLEIYADDVKCAHGATVGQLDDDALFYLRSRGITAQDATQLLIHAFCDDIVMNIPDSKIKQQINQNIVTYLG